MSSLPRTFPSNQEGLLLVERARKVLEESEETKYAKARKILHKAAELFLESGDWQDAANCYSKAAEYAHRHIKDLNKAWPDYEEAAKAYKNICSYLGTYNALKHFQMALEIHLELHIIAGE